MKLWVDDERPAPWGYTHVKTALDAIRIIRAARIAVSEFSLDHDLGDEELYGTGYDVLKELERGIFEGWILLVPKIRIHTQNPVARQRMLATVEAIERRLKEKDGSK